MERQESCHLLCSWCFHGNFYCSNMLLVLSSNDFIKPTCHVKHLPQYVEKYDEFKAKGVDVIAVVAANDAFVMSGWGRFEGLKDKVSFLE